MVAMIHSNTFEAMAEQNQTVVMTYVYRRDISRADAQHRVSLIDIKYLCYQDMEEMKRLALRQSLLPDAFVTLCLSH